jgi:carbon-monoxide dehydrogenase medium subunit
VQVPSPIEYARATSVDHAIALLERLGDEARIVAGGHSLLPMMKLRLANPEYLVDINDLHDELGYVEVGEGEVRIGAMTRHRELLESNTLNAVFPIFRDAERVIADVPVRNRGTLGGALCQADPSEDLSSVCTTLDARCVIRGSQGERTVSMDDFHRGPTRPRSARPSCSLRCASRCGHTAAAPTRRWTGGRATGPWWRRVRRSGWRTASSTMPGSG